MSHNDNPLEFFCDTVYNGERCKSKRVFVYGTSFVEAKQKLTAEDWRSFKRVGGFWEDFCPNCAALAADRHEEQKRNDERRERMKVRNAQ